MRSLVILAFCFLVLNVQGQEDRIKFSRISVESGLSQSSAFAIAQDSMGYIWIGTYDGLNRYSGYDIITYRHDPNDAASLADNYIQALSVDASGKLWIGTNSKGICIYDPTFETFSSLDLAAGKNAKGLKGSSILTLKKLDDQTMVALTDEGINLIDVTSQECQLITEDAYSKKKNAPSLLSYFNSDETTDKADFGTKSTCRLEDSKGNSWVGTDKGLLRKWSKNKWRLYVNEPFDHNSLSANEITSIMEDRGGVIWVGTSLGGVCKWDRLNEGILLYRKNPVVSSSLSDSKVRSFYEDSQGRVWVGTVAGGLNLWDRTTDSFSNWNTESGAGLNNNHIREIVEWQDQYIVATTGAGLQTFTENGGVVKFSDFPIEGMPATAEVWDVHVKDDELWIATNDNGLYLLKDGVVTSFIDDFESVRTTWVTTDATGDVWIATFGAGLYRKTADGFDHWNVANSNLSDDRIYSIVCHGEDIWLGTKGGVNHFDQPNQDFTTYSVTEGLPNETVMGIIPDESGGLWITTNRGICHLMLQTDEVVNYDFSSGLQNNEFLVHSFLKLSTGEMLFGGIDGFNVISEKDLSVNGYAPPVVLTEFRLESGDWASDTSINALNIIELEYYQNEFTFEFAGLGFANAQGNTYSYIMDGFDENWKDCETRRFAQYTNMPPGEYAFKVKATNADGVQNEIPKTIRIIIHPAYWQTTWFKVGMVLLVTLVIFGIYRMRVRQMQKRNQILEREVKVRTKEVVEQKEEIEIKNHQIEEALNDIHDSIQYAKRIQSAILPPNNLIKENLPDSFVLYLPKDIVAGDFYWLEKYENKVLFAAADCTGHGVPGAMVSVVCNNALNRSVREYGIHDPGDLLSKVRDIVIEEFEKSEEAVKDGMDIALCSLEFGDFESTAPQSSATLKYAGAHNPLWIIRDGEVLETKADKQPIGKFIKPVNFTTHEIQLKKGDTIYLSSDGFADQFGGASGKKFKSKTFKKLLIELNDKPMEEQKELIHAAFNEWMGGFEQLDDVCVIGVRV